MLVGLVSSNNLNAIETHELAPFYEDEGDPLSRATPVSYTHLTLPTTPYV